MVPDMGQDRDNIIAAVEDARATQEREAERLRDKLRGLGILQPALAGEPNGDSGVSNGMSEGAGKGRDMTTVREDYCEEKEVGTALKSFLAEPHYRSTLGCYCVAEARSVWAKRKRLHGSRGRQSTV